MKTVIIFKNTYYIPVSRSIDNNLTEFFKNMKIYIKMEKKNFIKIMLKYIYMVV